MHGPNREQQMAEAEELLADRQAGIGFSRDSISVITCPPKVFCLHTGPELDRKIASLHTFCDEHVDPVAIDRNAEIPQSVVDGLGKLGVLGLPAQELRRTTVEPDAYCRLIEVLGGHCATTALFVNAHHSIGIRGPCCCSAPPSRKRRWLPDLVSGKKLAAFALTEPRGRLRRRQRADDRHALRRRPRPTSSTANKRYITNGGIAAGADGHGPHAGARADRRRR